MVCDYELQWSIEFSSLASESPWIAVTWADCYCLCCSDSSSSPVSLSCGSLSPAIHTSLVRPEMRSEDGC
jgi:hypothetical protein